MGNGYEERTHAAAAQLNHHSFVVASQGVGELPPFLAEQLPGEAKRRMGGIDQHATIPTAGPASTATPVQFQRVAIPVAHR